MGQELPCRVTLGKKSFAGKAYLETDHVLFRGEERIKILLQDLTGVKASAGVLTLRWPGGPAAFELGDAAEKWEQKILHPPTRADKLGIKPGLTIRIVGDFAADFLTELSGLTIAPAKTKTDLLLFSAPARGALKQVPKLARSLTPAGALWIVYPKGVTEIREIEVLEAGRAAGLKDVKVASFSATHTALRFVIPRLLR
jgi:hypothetical protein